MVLDNRVVGTGGESSHYCIFEQGVRVGLIIHGLWSVILNPFEKPTDILELVPVESRWLLCQNLKWNYEAGFRTNGQYCIWTTYLVYNYFFLQRSVRTGSGCLSEKLQSCIKQHGPGTAVPERTVHILCTPYYATNIATHAGRTPLNSRTKSKNWLLSVSFSKFLNTGSTVSKQQLYEVHTAKKIEKYFRADQWLQGQLQYSAITKKETQVAAQSAANE